METQLGTISTNGTVSTLQSAVCPALLGSPESTLGRHLARRLVQIGVTDVFSVPGDFNLTLLDHLIAEPGLNNIGYCNELNAGYAADGYARSRGVGACVVTFTVGGLSVLNAIAGAYSENLPIICIVGGPIEFFIILLVSLISLKNFDAFRLLLVIREPVPFVLSPRVSNQMGLEAAVEAAAEFLDNAVKPVLVVVNMLCGQVTAQDVSTMIRGGQNSIIFLINNGGYTIEVEIHDGPYNVIKNWNYTGVVDAFHNGEGKCWTTKVRYEEELVEAIETATGVKKDCLCFIEIICHKDDTSKELLEWGSKVSCIYASGNMKF
ncbi:hypothetical protein IFM89_017217 [Coptis chinensis]|uniref:pyruvate decarboxylase n=1 Tax=Coptis chinensis TaxID=261450 RepID=A0A835LX63_9MAGN|nr:hypothetical protein IFM89_009007 [Coptis chinensis]KAF9609578.1 hypothetical protein IFM89_017217 [Coptis chinensis]